MNIYVSNLAFSVQDEELMNLFTQFGAVSSAKVISDRETGRSRGFGFVEMEDDAAAREAIQQLDQTSIDGRDIKVSEARPKPEKSFNNSPFKSDNNFSRRKW
ncbi:MAG: RNA-binding protein [Candidatus Pseudobacter hemicellulosilyticus]|uniref:RNA-binding protein n=1 Tax=Candidatus Pseudobacter hemicellulosilyticus TaxID=3121375 RepID=A0AAJ5WLG9_9BACT|nr:MAG: RNA-binding protein [Pseudobacter sp.]